MTIIQNELEKLKSANLISKNSYVIDNVKDENLLLPHRTDMGLSVIEKDGTNNAILAKFTSNKERDIYRGSGIASKNLLITQIEENLELPQIYESHINYDNFSNSHVKALYLEDGTLLDVVNKNWKVIQPFEIVQTFRQHCIDNCLEEDRMGVFKTEKKKETETGLNDIKQTLSVYASAYLNDSYEVSAGDRITGRLIFQSPYVNGKGFQVTLVSIRQVCTNLQAAAVRVKGKLITHVGELTHSRIKDALKESRTLWGKQKQQNRLFADTECTDLEAVMLLVNAFSNVETHREIAQKGLYELQNGGNIDAVNSIFFSNLWDKESAIVKECLEMYKKGLFTGSEFTGTKSTLWGLLNSVTEYINWKGTQKESTFSSLVAGHKMNQIAKFERTLTNFTSAKRKEKVSIFF